MLLQSFFPKNNSFDIQILNLCRRKIKLYKISQQNIINGFYNHQNNTKSKFEISPNPAKDYATLYISDLKTFTGTIEVFDVLSRNVVTKKINQMQSNIDLSSLESQVYQIVIRNNEGRIVHSEKLVVNK